MFRMIRAADRGGIAVRAFRAAVELDACAVVVLLDQDRRSRHRWKADER